MTRPPCLVLAALLSVGVGCGSDPAGGSARDPAGGSGGGGPGGTGGVADGGSGGIGGSGGLGGTGGESCVPDGSRNGTETDVDCGGDCTPCDDGLHCLEGGDCRSGVCDDAGSTCSAPACGDGVVNGDEGCDDGNGVEGDGCDSNCTASACGNGIRGGAESCDDGNAASDDGCSSSCGVEPGWVCRDTACAPLETVCNDGVDDNGAFGTDGADPSCQLPSYTPSCMPGLVRRVLRSDAVHPVPDFDLSGVTSSVPLDAGTATISQVMVSFTIAHTFAADLDVYLVSPGAGEFELSTDNGGAGQGYTDVVLSAACSTPVTAGTAPFSACFYPENLLGSLNGTAASGTWGLRVVDGGNGDTGTLRGWRLVLCTPP